jgi:general secretion pathway protein E
VNDFFASRTLVDELAEAGLVDADGAAALPLSEAEAFRELVGAGQVNEGAVLEIAARRLGIPFRATLADSTVPMAFVERVPFRYANAHGLVALTVENGRAEVAVSDPYALNALDEVAAMLGSRVEAVAAPRTRIDALINQAYQHAPTGADEALSDLDEAVIEGAVQEASASEDLLDVANRAPVVKLVNSVLSDALKKRATDVHFQPQADHLQVRARIDGLLHDLINCPRSVQDAVLSRVKVMAQMDIAERRSPQDGRASLRFAGREIDVRVSVVPTAHGEQAVLRLLDRNTNLYRLEDLGLEEDVLDGFGHELKSTHGILLLTGPTGSGKTTTLYAGLSRLNSRDKHIITIEDPIEYRFEGISQMQVMAKKNLTFANCLRSIVRQDPDIIMVGEIRDHETASIAVQSSLTGHLIFSTMHTNDAPGAAARLLDLGVEPYLVSSSLVAVLAQRLVRVVCEECAEPHRPTPGELADIAIEPAADTRRMRQGTGCARCLDLGYYGRTGIHEFLRVTDEVRRLISERATAGEIRNIALEQGMRTLRMDGARKVLQGATTVDEVLRVTQMDTV